MSSVRQIAREAGVSITTVSRALNNDRNVSEKTREMVLAIANKSGYISRVGRKSTSNIAMTYTGREMIASAFDFAVLEGISEGVDEHHLDLMILKPQRDKSSEETFSQYFMRKGVRGVILRTSAETMHVCEQIVAEGFPAIVLSERFDNKAVSYIDCCSEEETTRAVDYLFSLGHRRIAFGMNTIPDCDHFDRLQGYEASLKAHDAPIDQSLIFRNPANLIGGATILKMAMTMANPPTALVLADPQLAIGAINKAHELGIHIPNDLSIIGFDDGDARFSVYPTMTAVCQDARALGREATRALSGMLGRENGQRIRQSVSCFLEIHHSTAPPRSGSEMGWMAANGNQTSDVSKTNERNRAAG
ncbi:MAG: LacI family transcriptional regulator [Phycisphaerae bacterium]|nr:MAG: LacI family transcriptional regulator [Phycisphaerae bacterium]